ncbi:MAG: hypothetical protein WAU69_09980 [Solirubrobacteraceae bacterium]
MEATNRMHGCTVASNAYIAHARVLAKSFLAHNPGATLWVLVVDETPGAATNHSDEPFEVLTPEQVGIDRDELHRRATMYTAQALACSLKPVLARALLERVQGPVLFLDADSCVYADLTPLTEACGGAKLLLSPHMLDPHPVTGLDSPEQVILRVGVFNSGLLGAGAGAAGALDWWAQRTARRCIYNESLGLVLDQTWLTLMPLYFEHRILRDRGCNVAGWNLHTRDVEWEGDVPHIDGGPLRHFHFAGSFNPEHPETITPIEHLASWWAKLEQRPGAARLVAQYARDLLDNGYRQVRSAPPLLDLMPDGTPIADWMRESYRAALIEAEERGATEPPNPFSDGSERFQEWVAQRAAEAAAAPFNGADEPVGQPALAAALLDGRKLLSRIGELEQIRDDAIGWAQSVSSDLEIVRSERDHHAVTIESMDRSLSWRITRPLRSAKAILQRSKLD